MKMTKDKGIKIIGIVLTVVAVSYLCVAMHYANRFFPNTSINGMDCSDRTVASIEKKIQTTVEEYVLTINEANNVTEVITGADIDLQYTGTEILKEAIEEQKSFLWIKALFEQNDIQANIEYSYDEAKLAAAVEALECLKEENQVAPKNAYITYLDGAYVINPEEYGTQLKNEEVVNAIYKNVDEMNSVLDLSAENLYILPVYTKDSEEVVAAKDTLNKYISTKVTYSLDTLQVNVDGAMIKDWISVNEDMVVSIDANKVRAFTDTLGSTFNTPNTAERLVTPTGKVASVPNGRLGRRVGSAAECEQLIKEIEEGKTVTREPILSQKATPEGQYAWGNTYIEVDISAQHMWFIKNGSVVFQSAIVTGKPGLDTPVGSFTILEKLRNKTLRGNIVPETGKPEYETPVSYWARVTWSGIGFHDATWQSAFGGQRYRQGYGSHGCINMPLGAVSQFYRMIHVGCPVLIHY